MAEEPAMPRRPANRTSSGPRGRGAEKTHEAREQQLVCRGSSDQCRLDALAGVLRDQDLDRSVAARRERAPRGRLIAALIVCAR